jgi:oligopeptidase A
MAFAAQQAVAAGHEKATVDHGPWVFTLDMPSYLPCMQHLKNRSIRETMYRAYNTRASTGDVDNSANIRRILTLKKQRAQMLVRFYLIHDFCYDNNCCGAEA